MVRRIGSRQDRDAGIFLPKWAVPLVWTVLVFGIHLILPWAISRIGLRIIWSAPSLEAWNLTGLLLVAVGLALYGWCLVVHFVHYPASVRLGFSPPVLVVDGPYRISRNPMYLSALIGWLGWTIFYESPAVLIALGILWMVFSLRVIALEERQLEEQFGEEYLEYKRSVPRWIRGI
jgi:protein-S-isoprenylcysteine O-methyltransferase Ste14